MSTSLPSAFAMRFAAAALRVLATLIVTLSITPASLAAQKGALLRPKLPVGSDSNDVETLLTFANSKLADEPEQALRAYRWAGRLDPSNGAALAGERAARLFDDPNLTRQLFDSRRRNDKDMRILDSLEQAARLRNPFLGPVHEYELFTAYIQRQNPGWAGSELKYEMDKMLTREGAAVSAWMGHAQGELPFALEQYGFALKQSPKVWYYHVQRALIYAVMGSLDGAIAEYTLALQGQASDKDTQKKLVVLYQPQAMIYHSMGIIEESRGDMAKAKAHYSKAMEEDLSFWPAQLRLADLQAAAGDTAASLSQLDLVSQAQPDLAQVRYSYGLALVRAGRTQDALVQLKAATTIAPDYADPYYMMGLLYDRSEYFTEARQAYEAYLARAAQRAPLRTAVTSRLQVMPKEGQ